MASLGVLGVLDDDDDDGDDCWRALVVALVVDLTMVVVPVERVFVLALVLVRLLGLAESLFVLRRVFCFHCSFAQFSALGLYSHRMV